MIMFEQGQAECPSSRLSGFSAKLPLYRGHLRGLGTVHTYLMIQLAAFN